MRTEPQLEEWLRAAALPLRGAPLLLVAIFAPLLVLGLRSGVFGLPLVLVVVSWFLKYGYVLLDHAAQGRPGAPVLSAEDANPLGESRPLAHALLIGGFYGATGALGTLLGDDVATALRWLGLAALPALLATQAISGSLANALDPRALLGVTWRLGPAYVGVVAMAAACGWLARQIVLEGETLWTVLRVALLMQLWLFTFAALGGAVHARREQLGYEPEHSPERSRARADAEQARERNRFMEALFAQTRSGRLAEALESVRQRVLTADSAVAELSWIHDWATAWEDPRLANALAQDLLPRLLAFGRTGEALRITKARLQADPAFRPALAAQTLRLAELARAGGDRALARRLLEEFERYHPGDPACAAARRLADEFGRH
jgi:hypothetical protein